MSFVLCIMILKVKDNAFVSIVLSQIDVTCACCKFGESCLGSRVNDLVSLLCNERYVPRDLGPMSFMAPIQFSEVSKTFNGSLVCFNIEDTGYIVGLLIYYFINVKILAFVCVFLS